MTEANNSTPTLETDPRFPSGPWVGFFDDDPVHDVRIWMSMDLQFADQLIQGTGVDRIGKFTMRGTYNLDEHGYVNIWKRYDTHEAVYQGLAEDHGIWGAWELSTGHKGGYYIWPIAGAHGAHAEGIQEDEPVEVESEVTSVP